MSCIFRWESDDERCEGVTTTRPRGLDWQRVHGMASRSTTPLHPDAATPTIKPGWGWRFEHQPGQYIGSTRTVTTG